MIRLIYFICFPFAPQTQSKCIFILSFVANNFQTFFAFFKKCVCLSLLISIDYSFLRCRNLLYISWNIRHITNCIYDASNAVCIFSICFPLIYLQFECLLKFYLCRCSVMHVCFSLVISSDAKWLFFTVSLSNLWLKLLLNVIQYFMPCVYQPSEYDDKLLRVDPAKSRDDSAPPPPIGTIIPARYNASISSICWLNVSSRR